MEKVNLHRVIFENMYVEMGQEPHKVIQMGQNTSTVYFPSDKRIET